MIIIKEHLISSKMAVWHVITCHNFHKIIWANSNLSRPAWFCTVLCACLANNERKLAFVFLMQNFLRHPSKFKLVAVALTTLNSWTGQGLIRTRLWDWGGGVQDSASMQEIDKEGVKLFPATVALSALIENAQKKNPNP